MRTKMLQGMEVVASHREDEALRLSRCPACIKTYREGVPIQGDIGCLMPVVSCSSLIDLAGWMEHFKRQDVPLLVVQDGKKYRLYKERRCQVGSARPDIKN